MIKPLPACDALGGTRTPAFWSVGVGGSSRSVRRGPCAGRTFHSSQSWAGVVQRLGSSIGSSRRRTALNLDRPFFRPDLSQVHVDRAGVMRCRRSLLPLLSAAAGSGAAARECLRWRTTFGAEWGYGRYRDVEGLDRLWHRTRWQGSSSAWCTCGGRTPGDRAQGASGPLALRGPRPGLRARCSARSSLPRWLDTWRRERFKRCRVSGRPCARRARWVEVTPSRPECQPSSRRAYCWPTHHERVKCATTAARIDPRRFRIVAVRGVGSQRGRRLRSSVSVPCSSNSIARAYIVPDPVGASSGLSDRRFRPVGLWGERISEEVAGRFPSSVSTTTRASSVSSCIPNNLARTSARMTISPFCEPRSGRLRNRKDRAGAFCRSAVPGEGESWRPDPGTSAYDRCVRWGCVLEE